MVKSEDEDPITKGCLHSLTHAANLLCFTFSKRHLRHNRGPDHKIFYMKIYDSF